ncbi:hypothetical protein STTU_p0018 (plasmid) [Streptomyces sp. Tu6071]|uniref:hypothetical protein n=1 Tax=Streptomyces sp. Tu6071 TaxID=355249 RepID=UPI00020E6560|nr:hypothetical protein [Streptomyces sp. Tu6071]EGJ72631.1 hypothetical protein STTU_p0018 [Streptomyces sp. Tu6071]
MAEEEEWTKVPVEEVCRVCGLYAEGALWDEYGAPQYLTCPCCGVESGLGDASYEMVTWNRARWLESGAEWQEPEFRPTNWSLEEQLACIPAKWR